MPTLSIINNFFCIKRDEKQIKEKLVTYEPL